MVRLYPSADLRIWGHVVLDPRVAVTQREEAAIIQHPDLKPTKIAEGTLEFLGTETFRYAIETEIGSSGAAVLNAYGGVIACTIEATTAIPTPASLSPGSSKR